MDETAIICSSAIEAFRLIVTLLGLLDQVQV